jgi:hypothetical protein
MFCCAVLMLFVAVFQFTKARGQRHGAYTTPAGARRMREFNESGGIGPSAASRYAAYRDQVRELGRSSEGSFPNRAVRRAARMAPMVGAYRSLNPSPQIINEDEHEDDHLD